MSEVIANYMGFKYSAIVDVDNSDCGGLYDRVKVFSKIPIEIDSYPNDDQYYIKNEWFYKAIEKGGYLIDPDFITWDWIHDIATELFKEKVVAGWREMAKERFKSHISIIKNALSSNNKEESFKAIYDAIQFINSIEK